MALFDGLAKRLGYVKAHMNSAPAWLQAESSAQFTIPDRSLPGAARTLSAFVMGADCSCGIVKDGGNDEIQRDGVAGRKAQEHRQPRI